MIQMWAAHAAHFTIRAVKVEVIMINNDMKFSKRFDNTLLKPESTWNEIVIFIDETISYDFRNLVIPWYAIPYASKRVRDTDVGINVGPGAFPFGFSPTELKLREIQYYLTLGETVTDFDIVINISAVKSMDWDFVEKEMRVLSEPVKKAGKVCKFIIETSRLTEEEIVKVCQIIVDVPTVDYVKTGTGFGPRETSYRDVELINSVVEGKKLIKVSGGVRTLEQVQEFMKRGASIFGSSSSASIVDEYNRTALRRKG
jgi:deoxyribose-phosphate aldolase